MKKEFLSHQKGKDGQQGSRFSSHPYENIICYPTGNDITVRNVLDPSNIFVYRGHKSPTTVSKFSPNGCWVVSGDTSGIVRIWSWSDPAHLTKLETKLFTCPIKNIDWDIESKTILAMGDGTDVSSSIAKSLNFDSNVQSPKSSQSYQENRSTFLSSLAPREKLSITVSNNGANGSSDIITGVNSDTGRSKHSQLTPNSGRIAMLSTFSTIATPSYSDTAGRTATNGNMTTPALSSSAKLNDFGEKLPPPSPPPSPPLNLPNQLPCSQTPYKLHTGSNRREFTTPSSSSGSVLERIRAIEASFLPQAAWNSMTEEMVHDLDSELAKLCASTHTALHNSKQNFDRQIEVLQKEQAIW
jgi:hypothetical protein